MTVRWIQARWRLVRSVNRLQSVQETGRITVRSIQRCSGALPSRPRRSHQQVAESEDRCLICAALRSTFDRARVVDAGGIVTAAVTKAPFRKLHARWNITARTSAIGRPGAGNGGGAIWRVTTNESHSDLALSGEIDGRRALEFGGNDRDGTGGRSGRASLRSTRPDGYRAAVPAPVATSCDARSGLRALVDGLPWHSREVAQRIEAAVAA